MKAFFSKYSFLVIWIVAVGVVGGIFVLASQPALHPDWGGSGSKEPAVSPAPPPPAPATPRVDLVIVKTKAGNSLFVQWANLPDGTAALNIFRGTKNAMNGWSLWKTIRLTPGELGNGSTTIDLGKASLAGYEFYVQAVGAGGSPVASGASGGAPAPVLWTSGVTTPGTATSTPQSPVPANSPSSATGTVSSTPQTSPSPSSTTVTPPPAPSGTPFYSPQVQIEGYAPAQAGNFWVQHIDQRIQIGWQDLPSGTTSIVVLRSPNQDGPWSVILTQKNPGVSGSYSLQIVDDTLGQPYYYEMNAVAGNSTIAAYGPAYLPPQ